MKKQILIVDDKESIAKVIAIYFMDEYETVYHENPVKAIAWLEEGHVPDLILTDIRMPMMRGDEFVLYLKNNELFKSIPVVVLSAEDSSNERVKMLEAGAEDYILKPFNPAELKVRIKKVLK